MTHAPLFRNKLKAQSKCSDHTVSLFTQEKQPPQLPSVFCILFPGRKNEDMLYSTLGMVATHIVVYLFHSSQFVLTWIKHTTLFSKI